MRNFVRVAGSITATITCLAGCAESGDGTETIQGSYEATYDTFEQESIEAGRQRLSMPFERVDAFRDFSTLPACESPDVRYADVDSASFVNGLADPSTTLVTLDVGESRIRWRVIAEYGTEDACRVPTDEIYESRTAMYTLDGDTLDVPTVPSHRLTGKEKGLSVQYELEADDTLVLSHDIDVELAPDEANPDADLLEKNPDYGWAYGRWASTHNAHDTLVVDKKKGTLSFVSLRQVGEPDDAELPFPTVCKWQVQGDELRVRPGDDEDSQYLVYAGQTYDLAEFDGNGEGCEGYVAGLSAMAEAGTAHGSISLRRLEDGTLEVEGRVYEPVEG